MVLWIVCCADHLRRGKTASPSDQAVAAYDQSVANYRQTVLSGFEQVEDNVAALRILEREAQTQDKAVAAAPKYLDLAVTRYKGGVTSYLEVTTAQSASLADQVTAVNLLGRRMVDSVLLIQALGGGWVPFPNALNAAANSRRAQSNSSSALGDGGYIVQLRAFLD